MRLVRALSRPTTLLSVVLFFSSIMTAVLFARSMRGVPRAELAPSTHPLDLGNGEPGESLEGTLKLCNSGSKPLEFSIETSCGCSQVIPRTGVIGPGAAESILLTVRLPEYSNSQKDVTGVVKTNDPARPELRFAVTAKCPAPFVARPAHLDFGTLSPTEASTAVQWVEVTADRDDVDWRTVDVHNDSPHVQVKRQLVEDHKLVLEVGIAESAGGGELFGSIDLTMTGSPHVVRVPLHARIAEGIAVTPPVVFLRRDPRAGTFRSASVVVSTSSASSIDATRVALSGQDLHVAIAKAEQLRPTHCRLELIGVDASAIQDGLRQDVVVSISPSEQTVLKVMYSDNKE